MGTRVKATYVALNEYGKPIMSASTFEDLRKGLDDYYGVDTADAKCLGFIPYESKYPDEYEGHYSYSYSNIVSSITEAVKATGLNRSTIRRNIQDISTSRSSIWTNEPLH